MYLNLNMVFTIIYCNMIQISHPLPHYLPIKNILQYDFL